MLQWDKLARARNADAQQVIEVRRQPDVQLRSRADRNDPYYTGNYPDLEMMHGEVVKAEGQPAPHHLNSGRRPIGDEGHCLAYSN